MVDPAVSGAPDNRQKIIGNQPPQVECPYCKSKNTKKLGVLSRAMSVGVFGLGSSKLGKQWHCNNCNSDF